MGRGGRGRGRGDHPEDEEEMYEEDMEVRWSTGLASYFLFMGQAQLC